MNILVKEAQTRLADLIAEAAIGKDVMITSEDGTTVRLVLARAQGKTQPGRRGAYGSLKGQIWMADDFDAPLEDFEAIYNESES